jgi:hypothetical protein
MMKKQLSILPFSHSSFSILPFDIPPNFGIFIPKHWRARHPGLGIQESVQVCQTGEGMLLSRAGALQHRAPGGRRAIAPHAQHISRIRMSLVI